MKKLLMVATFIFFMFESGFAAPMRKRFFYEKYSLSDNYKYGKTNRNFQWNKILNMLNSLENFGNSHFQLATLSNYKNKNGLPKKVNQLQVGRYGKDNVRVERDKYGNRRNQGIPLYLETNLKRPEMYARDGELVGIKGVGKDWYKISRFGAEQEWLVPAKYVEFLTKGNFSKVAVVDTKNQNISTLEKVDSAWKIRSMNPATTGVNYPPYKLPTPVGVFVVQEKRDKMLYLSDEDREEIAGFAPYATRFSGGGYIHGVPTAYPNEKIIEYSKTLGTIKRSHMCVRNSSSHANYIYNWLETKRDLIIVIN